MYYLYSTNNLPGAKLIRWGGQDRCSHFVKYYPGKQVVIESTLTTGVREIAFSEWKKSHRIIYAQKLHLDISDHQLYILDQDIIGKKYDSKAVLFLSFLTLFKKAWAWLPFTENKWGAKDEYYCLEVVLTHKEILEAHGVILDMDIESLYPEDFYEILGSYTLVTEENPEKLNA